MAARRSGHEEEFREMMAALRETYGERMASPDLEITPKIFWWSDRWNKEVVYFMSQYGGGGSISLAEFQDIQKYIGRSCLICAGPLVPVFFPSNTKPSVCLNCGCCKASHKVVLDALCLFDN